MKAIEFKAALSIDKVLILCPWKCVGGPMLKCNLPSYSQESQRQLLQACEFPFCYDLYKINMC